jgi:hypothetical protein
MSRRIEIPLHEDASQLLERAREAALKYGARVAGDGERGEFAGKGIHGAYAIDGGRLAITISKKPMLLPWSVIEKTVRKFFT